MEDYQKRGYLLENFRLFHLLSAHVPQVDYHYHEFCKLILLHSGSGSYTVDSQRYRLQPGDVIMVGSRSIHRPDLESGTAYERIIIYISPEFLRRESTPDCSLTDIFSGRNGHVLRLKEETRAKVFALAAELEKEVSSPGYGRIILSNTALLRLLVELGAHLQEADSQYPSPLIPKSDRILQLQKFIETHLAEDLDIDRMAEQLFISKYHLMRQFRRETGVTIHAYLSQRRLLHARNLIENGMRSTEACYRCGFRSYSSFTRSYAKHFGTTPTGRLDSGRKQGEVME